MTIVQDDAEFLFRSDERVAQSMRQLKELGVDRVRLNAGWSAIAPNPGALERPDLDLADPGAYPRANWRRLDRAVRAAEDAGLQVMIDIAFWAPRWATTGNPTGPPEHERYNVDPVAFTEFATAVVRRYSGSFVPEADAVMPGDSESLEHQLMESPLGLLLGDSGASPPPPPAADLGPLPKVSWWTVWNEPNHGGFLQPQHTRLADGSLQPNTPHVYRRMVEMSYPIIKRLQPDSLVLVGGLASFGSKKPTNITHGIPPLRFVRELACVDQKLRPLTDARCANYRPLQGDGFAHHPYSLLNRPDFQDPFHPDSARIGALNRLSNLLNRLIRMRRIDPKLANLYLTEFGYETNPPDPDKPYGLAQQARFINWAEYLAYKNPQVRSWPQFMLRDLGVVSAEKAARGARPFGEWQSGLLFEDGRPKPSATSFRLALFVDCVRPKRRSARRRLVIWGHVRPGTSASRVVLEQSRAGAQNWKKARTARTAGLRKPARLSRRAFATSASGIFVRHAPWRPGVRFRLRAPGPGGTAASGLSVRPVPCGRKPETKLRTDGEY